MEIIKQNADTILVVGSLLSATLAFIWMAIRLGVSPVKTKNQDGIKSAAETAVGFPRGARSVWAWVCGFWDRPENAPLTCPLVPFVNHRPPSSKRGVVVQS